MIEGQPVATGFFTLSHASNKGERYVNISSFPSNPFVIKR